MDREAQDNASRARLYVRAWREYRALSQGDLASLSGVTRETINRIENGARDARPSTVRKLAKALEVKPHELTAPPPDYFAMAADMPPPRF